MLETIMKIGIVYYVMGTLAVAGGIAKMISNAALRKLVLEASEIQKSNHKLMKLVKAKFEHLSMVSDKVQNVEAFVKKYLYEYRVAGVRLCTWQSISEKIFWIVGCIGTLGVFGAWSVFGVGEAMFQCAAVTATMMMLLVVVRIWGNETVRMEMVRNYMIDYLENICVHRYEKMSVPIEEKEAEKVEPQRNMRDEISVSKEKLEQEMRIRAILEEFLA